MDNNIIKTDNKIHILCIVENIKTYNKLLEYLYCDGKTKCHGFYSYEEFCNFCKQHKNDKNIGWCVIEVVSSNLKIFGIVYLDNVINIIGKIRNTFPKTSVVILTNISADSYEMKIFKDNNIPIICGPTTKEKIKEICKLLRR